MFWRWSKAPSGTVFLYNDTSRAATLRTLGRFASNPRSQLLVVRRGRAEPKRFAKRASKCRRLAHASACPCRPTDCRPRAKSKANRPWLLQRTTLSPPPLNASCSSCAVERNASPLTVKSYREDLDALIEYLSERHRGVCPMPAQLTTV